MDFLPADKYQVRCEERFAYYSKQVRKLLPLSRVEHIGSSSIPGAISKGDLDIFVGVNKSDLENSVKILQQLGFREKQDTRRTGELCMLESLSEDVAFQVVANDSEYELFLTFRDKLRNDPVLVQQYNELKLSSVGLTQDEYREKKSAFIESILAQG